MVGRPEVVQEAGAEGEPVLLKDTAVADGGLDALGNHLDGAAVRGRGEHGAPQQGAEGLRLRVRPQHELRAELQGVPEYRGGVHRCPEDP